MDKKFDFNKITLIPQFSYVESRSECDTSIKFGGYRFKLPIVPANMESIIDEKLAIELAKNEYIQLTLTQSSGGAVNVTPVMWIRRVR